jgi:hypothetical protein
VRLILGFALAGALLAGCISVARQSEYRAHAYVIRVPPDYGGDRGLELARSDTVMLRALALAQARRRSSDWLRRRVGAQLTGRRDLALTVRASDRREAITLATAYAKAVKRELPDVPGLATRGRGARTAEQAPGLVGWVLAGSAVGVWLGAAAAIVRNGSGRAPRRASAPCARATRPTRG